eukprot:c17844_g2_i2.p1 GENE.c17844_g2_i2~~c17844_g2_i2.p1  ORF type:complete len:730 (+),score=185.82 c17844_g2_i2:1616-3805(+)
MLVIIKSQFFFFLISFFCCWYCLRFVSFSQEVFSMSTKHVSLPIRVSPNEVMLTKDQVTSFHDPTGAPSREYRITWNDVPQSMVLHPPYVIAGTPRTIEVHILHTGELVEVLPEKAGQVVAARMLDVDERESGIAMNVDDSNATLILFERRLCTLELYNIVHQIKQLQHLGHWKEALHLSGYLPTTQIELREDIQREHAVALFAEKKFEKAMQHFKDCDTQVGIVLALYQHLLLPPDSEEPHSKISGIDEANLQPATLALIPYLDFKRTSGKLSREEATMVDTTLFKCYLYAKPSNLMTFLRKENQANLEDVRVLLERHKKFAELLNFLCARGHFEDAMKLLQKLTAESATFKLEDVGVYVRQFLNEGNAPPALLLDHMDWVFEKYDEKALDIVHDCVRFPPEVVLKHLETIKQGGLRLKYLENLLLPFLSKAADAKEREKYRQPVRKSVAAETTDAQLIKQTLMKAKLHDSLAMEYLTKINKFEKKPDGHAEFEKALQEFLSFLRMNPSYYNASAILDMVEDLKLEKLNPARAVLLSVMGKHASALRSFIKLKMFTEAEAHCQAYYDPANPEASGLFLELIKVCLDQTEDYQPQVDRAIEIFHRHFERIDVRKALEILPGNSSLTKLMPTLEAVIQRNNRAINENKLVKSLLIAEERQLRERLIRARSKKFKIGVKDMCAVCSKQIDRGQVFARYPNDVTVHGGCLTNPKKCPITGIEFSVDSQFEEL